MSDISILSGRYDTVSKFSNKLNEAILLLKKAALKANQPTPGVMQVSDWSETNNAEAFLGKLLGELIEIPAVQVPAETMIPQLLFDGFLKLRQNEPGFDQKLKGAHYRLTHFRDLTEEDFEVFDKLLSIADADVSAAFSKLWRKR